MKDSVKGGFVVVLMVTILALGCGIVFGMNHVGEDVSRAILPTSLTESSHTINVINEESFTANNISIKNPQKNTYINNNNTNVTKTNNINNNKTLNNTVNTSHNNTTYQNNTNNNTTNNTDANNTIIEEAKEIVTEIEDIDS